MTKTLKKTVKTAPAFDRNAYVQAGAFAARADMEDRAVIEALVKRDEQAGGAAYVLGYVAQRCFGGVNEQTLGKAQAVIDAAGPGSQSATKRTAEEHAACRAGAKRWERIRKRYGVKAKDNRGGARTGAGKPKASDAPKAVTVNLKPTATAADMVTATRAVKQAFAVLLTLKAAKELPGEALAIASEITVLINRFDVAVSNAAKAK